MEKANQKHIDWFRQKGIDYWFFSKGNETGMARALGDVPIELIEDLADDEAEQICAKIRQRLDDKYFDHENYDSIYVKVLVYFNDTSALDVLIKWKRHFKERQRYKNSPGCNWSSEIRLLKEAIKHLRRKKCGQLFWRNNRTRTP